MYCTEASAFSGSKLSIGIIRPQHRVDVSIEVTAAGHITCTQITFCAMSRSLIIAPKKASSTASIASLSPTRGAARKFR